MSFTPPPFEPSSPIGNAPLLRYQRQWLADESPDKSWDKSRRIGASWAEAWDDVLYVSDSGRGNVYYQSFNHDMTRQFIDDCKAAAAITNKILLPEEINAGERDAKVFELRMHSGRRISAMTAAARNFRSKGKTGDKFVVDECRELDNFVEIEKAVTPTKIWGARIARMSSAADASHPWSEFLHDARAGKVKTSLHRTTFADALRDGLYRKICQVQRRAWAVKDEEEFYFRIIEETANPATELFCIPGEGDGGWLVRALIERTMADKTRQPLRWSPPATDFVQWGDGTRGREVEGWLDNHLDRTLNAWRGRRGFVGIDFGRVADLTVIAVAFLSPQLRRDFALLELRDCPFEQQAQVAFAVVNWLTTNALFGGVKIDGKGNGSYLAERLKQRYGTVAVEDVNLMERWYAENMPPVKAAFEDGDITLPRDDFVLEDLRAVRVVNGVPRPPTTRTADAPTASGGRNRRHCDAAVAIALAYAASRSDAGPVEFETIDDDSDDVRAYESEMGAWVGAA